MSLWSFLYSQRFTVHALLCFWELVFQNSSSLAQSGAQARGNARWGPQGQVKRNWAVGSCISAVGRRRLSVRGKSRVLASSEQDGLWVSPMCRSHACWVVEVDYPEFPHKRWKLSSRKVTCHSRSVLTLVPWPSHLFICLFPSLLNGRLPVPSLPMRTAAPLAGTISALCLLGPPLSSCDFVVFHSVCSLFLALPASSASALLMTVLAHQLDSPESGSSVVAGCCGPRKRHFHYRVLLSILWGECSRTCACQTDSVI